MNLQIPIRIFQLPNCLLCMLLGAATTQVCVSAEITLKSSAMPQGVIVRLGDVAQVKGTTPSQTKRLAALPLMPAPAPGTMRALTSRQIRDMMHAAGINVAAHRLSGAERVTVGLKTPASPATRERRLSAGQLRRVEEDLHAAIGKYLTATSKDDQPWQVQSKLSPEALEHLAEATVPWTISGGTKPYLGVQTFEVTSHTTGGIARVPVEAIVQLPEPLIVTERPLTRGSIVRQSDVALKRLSKDELRRVPAAAMASLDDVIGKELRRSVVTGQVLAEPMLAKPIIVRRGQTVKVHAFSHGIRVTTFATAKQDGARDDLILVEPPGRREPYAAQVSGPQQVRILARSATALPTDEERNSDGS